MKTFISIYLVLISLLPGGQSGMAAAEDHLTDGQKKAIVYRMYADYRRDFSKVEDISPIEAMALYDAGKAIFVDTRKPSEMAVSMLPGAIPERKFLKDPSRYKEKTVIGYCTISYRSGLLAKRLARQGVRMVNLKGGILAWTLEGFPVFDPRGRTTRRIHVFGKKWNFPPDGYEAVMFDRF
jgi:rhodanese-related sulfurtransferase